MKSSHLINLYAIYHHNVDNNDCVPAMFSIVKLAYFDSRAGWVRVIRLLVLVEYGVAES
jgi:hypothetical protein